MTDQGLIWHDPNWQKQAHEWVRSQAEQHSIQIAGEIEQNHAYAWSTVMRVPTNQGMLFFKATAGETLFEIALTEKLAGWFPDRMPELVAVDTERGWMLMRDGGARLRNSIRPKKDVMPWEPVIAQYADLQIGLADHVDEILALGIPDHRLAKLPALYSQLLADETSLMIDQEKGLSSADFQKLLELRPRFEKICADLAAFGVPETLNNGDFHDGNVLLKNRRVTFFDWGDATVTHPFVSLRTWFVSMEMALELEEDYAPPTAEMTKLLHCYLERWKAFGDQERLLEAYSLSRPVAAIVKTQLWHTTITRMDPSVRTDYAWIVPELFREFLHYEKTLR
ncbi:MAG: phosphotransferase [Anaerolineales bacterium]